MSKIKVKLGKREVYLTKSRSFVGLKPSTPTAFDSSANVKSAVRKKVYEFLGGFNVMSLQSRGSGLDDALDVIRSYDSVDVGTHVYYAEGSNKMLVPTGEIYIKFYEGVSEEEQNLVLDEYNLTLSRRRNSQSIVAKVTANSLNPIKIAAQLQQFSLIQSAEPDLDAQVDEYDFTEPDDDLLDHQWHLRNTGTIPDKKRCRFESSRCMETIRRHGF